jgi:hypothetical protein
MKPDDRKYKKFVRWYATSSKRNQEELDEFCEKNEIMKDEIQEWMFSNSFNDDIFDEAVNYAKSKTPMILKTLIDKYEQTKEPAYLRHIKDFMALNKKDTPPQGNNYQFNFLNPTDEQYRQILERETRILNIGSAEEPIKLLPDNRPEL